MTVTRHFSATAPFALFEDNLSDPPRAQLLTSLRQHIRCVRADEVEATLDAIAALQDAGCWIALAASYELGYALETKLLQLLPATEAPLLQAWAFDQMTPLQTDALKQWWDTQLASLSPQTRDTGLLSLTPGIDQSQYLGMVERALRYIREGDCYQVNLSFPMRGQSHGDPLALFARLREAQPVRYGAFIRGADECILSRSPELFVARRNTHLECRPMKGTATRDPDPQRDIARSAALLASSKDRAENLMIVDLIRNDLGRLVAPGGVHVERLFELETYRSVHQLTSTVTAEPVTAKLPAVLHALFPCGSITGAPKIRAMQIIRELENEPRGLYCGALGYLAPDGDYSLNVPIRTLHVAPDGACRMDVGSGIVADSNPFDEYAECLSKASFATALSDELQLIETLRFEGGSIAFPLLDEHMARLSRSAAELGFHFDEIKVREKITLFAGQLEPVTQRVRLLLDRDGEISLSAASLDAATQSSTVDIGAYLLNPDDLRLRHKTTARRFYDESLKRALAAGHFDSLFFNTRGELCEGARSNVFVETRGVLHTPRVECGLLPGVMRGKLLREGKARERVLHGNDLLNADRLWVANALRGLVEVKLAATSQVPL